MPSKVRIIAGPRNRDYDDYISDLVEQEGYGRERQYFGCVTQEEADKVRKGLRQAGRHLGVSVKAFWVECQGCELGGPSCAYHVKFSAYHPDAARDYKARQLKAARGG